MESHMTSSTIGNELRPVIRVMADTHKVRAPGMRGVTGQARRWNLFPRPPALLTRPSFAIPLHMAQTEQPRVSPGKLAVLAQAKRRLALNVSRSQRRVVAN